MIHSDKVKKVSEKKQALIDALKNSTVAIDDIVYIKNDKEKDVAMIVTAIDGDMITACEREYYPKYKNHSLYSKTFHKNEITNRYTFEIGADPFDRTYDAVRSVAYSMDSILFNLNVLGDKERHKEYETKNGVPIHDLNWNPFVYNKNGEKEYYQRPFVWTLEDKQLLIESIYQGIDCGKIIIRKRSWEDLDAMGDEKGEEVVYFNDLVDGKQRLDAIRGFIMGEYPDIHGNYYADLSFRAQHHLTNHQLFSFAELPESTTDEEVLAQFLKLNFAGVPQSKEHIEFVKSLKNKI